MASSYPSGSFPDDITILNSYYFPESLPSATVNFVRKSKECQKRLEELLSAEEQKTRKISDMNHHFLRDGHTDNHFTENHGMARKWNGQDEDPDNFSSPNSAVYWDCSYSDGTFHAGIETKNNAVINLMKMFLP